MKQYGKWVVGRSLGEGGQAHIFLVHDAGGEQGDKYVLKRLKNPARIARFEREVRAALKLEHENVLKIIEYDIDNEPAFIVSEYCAGGPLSRAHLSGYTLLDRLRLFGKICLGVGHAHSNGVVHRDLKPDNIFLRDAATPVVGDFGICFTADSGWERITLTDEVAGSRFYTAPELADGFVERPQPSADVYSLGKILYWMLSGRVFEREKHRLKEFDLASQFRGRYATPYELVNELLDRTITVDPGKRCDAGNIVFNELQVIIDRIEARAHALDLRATQLCMYCADGFYRPLADADSRAGADLTPVTNFGITPVGAPDWIILACDKCGNVQLFRPDHAGAKGVWRGRAHNSPYRAR
jgi:serine/threonine protein kinase